MKVFSPRSTGGITRAFSSAEPASATDGRPMLCEPSEAMTPPLRQREYSSARITLKKLSEGVPP
jgi:hypothetical protein